MKEIYADFNNFCDDGLLDLNCVGSVSSIRSFGADLQSGEKILLTDGELWAVAEIMNNEDGRWYARAADWKLERRTNSPS